MHLLFCDSWPCLWAACQNFHTARTPPRYTPNFAGTWGGGAGLWVWLIEKRWQFLRFPVLHQQGARQRGVHMWSMRLVPPITEATTVRWCWLASSYCCGLSFLTDHPPAQTHCWKHAMAQMGVTFNYLLAAYLMSPKPSPLHTIFSLLARITASWDTQNSEELGEALIAGELKKEEGNMMHIHAAVWS